MTPKTPRHCVIVSAAIETKDGAGDGAYDLLSQDGPPGEIGRMIAESLAECDLHGGRRMTAALADAGEPLYMILRIKVYPSAEDAKSHNPDDE